MKLKLLLQICWSWSASSHCKANKTNVLKPLSMTHISKEFQVWMEWKHMYLPSSFSSHVFFFFWFLHCKHIIFPPVPTWLQLTNIHHWPCFKLSIPHFNIKGTWNKKIQLTSLSTYIVFLLVTWISVKHTLMHLSRCWLITTSPKFCMAAFPASSLVAGAHFYL